ncbi:hypothetical protein PybrP1_008975 [[Pythium] brassicae (nom. inval.)]|nr:hypothetical protein PybrP1_008975 [[Pythium] brassicae (nom. inval.)]
MQRPLGLMRSDLSLMTFRGRSNTLVELAKRMCSADDEWQRKCDAMRELKALLSAYAAAQSGISGDGDAVDAALFTPENIQTLTQPFRSTLLDLRSTVVKEACDAFAALAACVGPARSKIIVRDVFPTLLEARGASNKVRRDALSGSDSELTAGFWAGQHTCGPPVHRSRHPNGAESLRACSSAPVAPHQQVRLGTRRQLVLAVCRATRRRLPRHLLTRFGTRCTFHNRNREVRESCVRYLQLALATWDVAVFDQFNGPLQHAISSSLSDASQRSREIARECYWFVAMRSTVVEVMAGGAHNSQQPRGALDRRYAALWPDELEA